MGKPERKNRERIGSSSSYFLRCFGVSRKIHSDKPMLETAQDKKTRRRWFSRPIKTGEITPAEKQYSIVEDDKPKLFQVIRHGTDRKNIASSDYKAVEATSKEKNMNEQRDINADPLSLSGYETCHKEVSTTFHGIRGKLDPAGSKPKSLRVRKRLRVGSFDPVIGISIIMVTLIIMLTWGRLCAILCTSTWCYFLPRIKEAAKCKRSRGGKPECGLFPGDFDLNSEAYKKKVVLDGFLVRERRVSL